MRTPESIYAEADLIRLAAFIDGEGMIDIHTHTQFRPHLGRDYTTVYVRIVMVNTDPRLTQWCKSTFGGTANFVEKRKDNQRPILKWYCSSAKAAEILRQILPYLILKKEQAECALAFQETVTPRWGRRGMPESVRIERDALANKMKALKRTFVATREHQDPNHPTICNVQ